MARADRFKEAIGWLKVLFVTLAAVDVSLIAWLAENLQTANAIVIVLAVVAVICTSAGIIGVNHAAYRRIVELENL
jgi:4-hydroxybenzoate polyprenyltransferase